MQIATQLDQLRRAFPDCHAVAYADFEAGMILAKSATATVPQEQWDDLSNYAFEIMNGEPAALACNAMSSTDFIGTAVVLRGGELTLVVRSPMVADDAIFCIAEPGLDVEHFLESSIKILSRIAQDV